MKRWIRQILIIGFTLLMATTVWATSRYETEPNNSYSTGKRTYDGDNNYGAITSTSDVDWWWVQFDASGTANFWLSDIPTGCNFDLYVYRGNGTNLVASSTKEGRYSELITIPVVAGTKYYFCVRSASGSSSSQYVVRAKYYPPVVYTDRVASTYSQTAPYRDYMEKKMNCYGYALHIYSLTGTGSAPYKQTPGEFSGEQLYPSLLHEVWGNLGFLRNEGVDPITDGEELLDDFENKMKADFNNLNALYGSEWYIRNSSLQEEVPAGFRKIALVVRTATSTERGDYHFYFRHSDQTWSHKPGELPIRNTGSYSGVPLTDANIASHISEGGYTAGVRYYLIKKSAVVDYRHYGGSSNSSCTQTAFTDGAGDVMTKSKEITAGTYNCFIDYPLDIDYFSFVPTVSKTYTIQKLNSANTMTFRLRVYDQYGQPLASQLDVQNPSVSVSLTAGNKVFIRWETTDGTQSCGYTFKIQ